MKKSPGHTEEVDLIWTHFYCCLLQLISKVKWSLVAGEGGGLLSKECLIYRKGKELEGRFELFV
jgi:hypothetical protein